MNYIIIFDYTQIQFETSEIHRYITTSPQVTDWWHYLPNVYIVSTGMTIQIMTQSMTRDFPGMRFFISRIDPSEVNGILPQKAWDWFKNKTQRIFNTKPAAPSPNYELLDLLKAHSTPVEKKYQKSPLDDFFKGLSITDKK